MKVLLALLPALLAAAPKAAKVVKPPPTQCGDRDCLVSAAEDGLEANGRLEIFEWLKHDGPKTLKGATGHAEISVRAVDVACVLTLRRVFDDLPEKEGMTKQEQLAKNNAEVANELTCKGSPKAMAKLLKKLGKDEATVDDLAPCHPSKCDPAPPLAKGCKAGKCTDGAYLVTCGKKTCKMTGLTPDQLTPGCT